MAHYENLSGTRVNEFIILLGYKGYFIKEYFANYILHQSDVTIDMSNGEIQMHNKSSESWKVTPSLKLV